MNAQLTSIQRVEEETSDIKAEIKTLRDRREELLSEYAEYDIVQNLAAQLKEAKNKLKEVTAANEDIVSIEAELKEKKLKQRDLKEILSYNVAAYRRTANSDYLPHPSDNRLVRPIFLSGKLGKPEARAVHVPEEAVTR